MNWVCCEVVEEEWFKERVERVEMNFGVGKGIVVVRFRLRKRGLKLKDFNIGEFQDLLCL